MTDKHRNVFDVIYANSQHSGRNSVMSVDTTRNFGRPSIDEKHPADGEHEADEYWRNKAEEALALVAHELKSPLTVIRGSALFALSHQTLPPEELRELLIQIDH